MGALSTHSDTQGRGRGQPRMLRRCWRKSQTWAKHEKLTFGFFFPGPFSESFFSWLLSSWHQVWFTLSEIRVVSRKSSHLHGMRWEPWWLAHCWNAINICWLPLLLFHLHAAPHYKAFGAPEEQNWGFRIDFSWHLIQLQTREGVLSAILQADCHPSPFWTLSVWQTQVLLRQ